MIRRYSHIAIVTIESQGELNNGEYIPGPTSEKSVKGQYFASNSGNQVKENRDGNQFNVKGEFSTTAKKVEGATRIKIDSISLDAKIESWEQFQTHSVIYI